MASTVRCHRHGKEFSYGRYYEEHKQTGGFENSDEVGLIRTGDGVEQNGLCARINRHQALNCLLFKG